MNYKIEGGNLPVVLIQLEAGEQIVCEGGSMSWMDDEIEMKTEGGGVGKMFGRMFTGESLFQNRYVANRAGEIAFASSFPGSIRAMEVTPEIRLMSIVSMGFVVLPAAAVLAVLLYFYHRITPGALPVKREQGNPRWWMPMAAGAFVFAAWVINSAIYEFSGGAACVSMWFA